MSAKTTTDDTSTDTEEQMEKVAQTASQMGHRITGDGEGVEIVTLDDNLIQFIDYGDVSFERYEVRVNNHGDVYDDFSEAFSALVDELLI